MSLSLSLATFFIIWWTVLFAVLPFGVRTQSEAGEIVPGTPESARDKPQLVKVFVITTVVSVAVFALVRWIYLSPSARLWLNAVLRDLLGIELFPT